jgi:hypothetical protein
LRERRQAEERHEHEDGNAVHAEARLRGFGAARSAAFPDRRPYLRRDHGSGGLGECTKVCLDAGAGD